MPLLVSTIQEEIVILKADGQLTNYRQKGPLTRVLDVASTPSLHFGCSVVTPEVRYITGK